MENGNNQERFRVELVLYCAVCVQHGKNLSCTFAKGKKLFLATTISSALSQKRQNTITACKLFEAYQKSAQDTLVAYMEMASNI